MKRKYWIILAILILAVGGYYFYRSYTAKKAETAVTTRTATISYGTVQSTISGVGTVRAKQSAAIAWQTSGKVAVVSAEIGQQVQVGDVLAKLDQSSLSTTIIQAQADLISAKNDLEDLQQPDPLKIAEAEKTLEAAQEALDNLLAPSAEVILQAEQVVTDAQEAVEDAQTAVDKLARGRGNQEQIELARAKYLLAQDKVDRYQDLYASTHGDTETDPDKAMALSNLANAETARDVALATLNWYLGTPSQEEIDAANFDLALAQAELAKAQETLETLKSPTASDVTLAQAMVEAAQEDLEIALNGATEEELIIAQTRVTVAQATLDQAHLTAPFSGMITNQNVLTGDLVSQGKEAFQIHDLSMMFVEISISEVDISQVKVGQEAELVFDAIADKEYTAVVTKISKNATSSMGVVNYPVTVQITNPDEDILPGMTASVEVVVEKRENVMMVPNNAIRTINGERTVTILFEGKQVSVPVTVGLTADSYSEVSSTQLREGDTVVIITSSGSATTSNNGQQMMPGGGVIEFNGGMGGGPGMIP